MFRAYAPIVRSEKFRQAAYGILSCLPLRGGVRSGGVRRVYAEGVTARAVTPSAYTRSRYSDWLRAGRSGDRIPVGTRFFAPVQTGLMAHPAYCTMGTGSFPGVKSGRGVIMFNCKN
jgi:hypothetical protein